MTGEKNRYKTHEQLWKLEDGELSTPQHDELVLQLLNPENAKKFSFNYELNLKWEYSFGFPNYPEEIIKEFEKELKKINEKNHWIDYPIIRSEVPVCSGYNNFIIGYIDILLVFRNIFNFFAVENDMSPTGISVYEGNCSDLNSKILGVMNVYNMSYKCDKARSDVYNIEVKPKIKSFGETLRQINTYRHVDRDSIYYIYSPDTTFKAAFSSQGIQFKTPSDLGL